MVEDSVCCKKETFGNHPALEEDNLTNSPLKSYGIGMNLAAKKKRRLI